MPVFNQIRKELQEKCNHQQANMHSVDIGIHYRRQRHHQLGDFGLAYRPDDLVGCLKMSEGAPPVVPGLGDHGDHGRTSCASAALLRFSSR